MCDPVTQICATPSHPFDPYAALQVASGDAASVREVPISIFVSSAKSCMHGEWRADSRQRASVEYVQAAASSHPFAHFSRTLHDAAQKLLLAGILVLAGGSGHPDRDGRQQLADGSIVEWSD